MRGGAHALNAGNDPCIVHGPTARAGNKILQSCGCAKLPCSYSIQLLAQRRGSKQPQDGDSNGLNDRSKPFNCLVAWGGIEPPTRGFSIRCSTN
jgi:hypothetical protein